MAWAVRWVAKGILPQRQLIKQIDKMIALESAAEQGDVDAMYELGLVYEEARGVTQDLVSAKKYYEKAAAKGDTRSVARLQVVDYELHAREQIENSESKP